MKILLVILPVIFIGYTATIHAQPRIEGDTLYTAAGDTVYAGQKIKIGKPTGENGHYRTIGHKNTNWLAVLPINYGDYHDKDPYDERNKDLVVSFIDGKELTVVKFKKYGTKKHGYSNMAILKGHGGTKYFCNVEEAIKTKEISL